MMVICEEKVVGGLKRINVVPVFVLVNYCRVNVGMKFISSDRVSHFCNCYIWIFHLFMPFTILLPERLFHGVQVYTLLYQAIQGGLVLFLSF